jgi:catechol 2,3-dioxygenase-like lactoylglutathione lyase family enzyme
MKQCIGDLRCIVISARDVDRAVEFWCAVLGSDIGPRYDPYVELIKDGQLKVTIQHVENDWALGRTSTLISRYRISMKESKG